MRSCYKTKMILLILFITLVNVSYGEITISTHSVFMAINEKKCVTIEISNLSNTNFEIELSVQHGDIVNVKPNVLTPNESNEIFEINIESISAGHSEIISNTDEDINVSGIFLIVNVCNSRIVDILSKIVGWIYIISWGASFYPQIYSNYKRQCVVGLHFDYLALDIVGYVSFGIYIHSLYFIPEIQDLYFDRYPRGLIPVKTNDVVYNIHGIFAIVVTIMQCFIYEKGEQRISTTAKLILCAIGLFYITSFVLFDLELLQILDLFYFCSYVKLVVTVLKYIPQAYLNYKRKSTDGWSIGLVFLDLNGGLFSILQMILDSYNYNDWVSILGNPTKFGLGIVTILFHCLFMIQHYVLYKTPDYMLVG